MRATWRGHLKISLVNIPILVFPATDAAAALSFNQLHDACQTRVQQRRWCPQCAREVPNSEIVKGFEFAKGQYVVLRDEDLDAVRPESTRVIDLVQFAPARQLDPMYIDRTYYLAPDKGGADAFVVMREAMADRIGIGKLAIYGREYLIAVRPLERALVLHTLHHAAELRALEDVVDLTAIAGQAPAADVKLARQVVATFTAPLRLDTFTDAYVAGLRQVIDRRIAGEDTAGAPAAPAPRATADLKAALLESLAAVRGQAAAAAPRKRRGKAA